MTPAASNSTVQKIIAVPEAVSSKPRVTSRTDETSANDLSDATVRHDGRAKLLGEIVKAAEHEEDRSFIRKACLGIAKSPLLPITVTRELLKSTELSTRNRGQTPDQQSLKAHLLALTSIDRSFMNPAGLAEALEYIRSRLQEFGVKPEKQTFTCPHGEAWNLMTSFGPKDAPRIVIGAHYDVCVTEVPDGKFKPGADDNGTAVSALIELVRMFREHQPKLSHRVDFVAYANEEPPYFRTEYMGSAVHAKSLKNGNVPVRGMIALDMLGYFSDAPNSQGCPALIRPLVPRTANFIAVVGELESLSLVRTVKKGMGVHSTVPARMLSAPSFIPGMDYSDHQNYSKYGWPAIMVTDTSFYRNPNYHRATDTAETINMPKFTEVVRGLYGVISNL